MSDIIKELAKELGPLQQIESRLSYFAKWGAISSLLIALSLYVLPFRPDIEAISHSKIFLLENVAWLALSLFCSLELFNNTFPEERGNLNKVMILVISVSLLGLALTHSPSIFNQNVIQEIEIHRGICALIISIASIVMSLFFFKWARRGASASPRLSGVWATLSGSALGCFLMQIICVQDNSLHLIIWHFLPIFALSLIGQKIAAKVLSW